MGTPALNEALAKAQKEFQAIKKGRTAKVKGKSKAGHDIEYSYKYADLSDIFDAVREPLHNHGLSLNHTTQVMETGRIRVVARLRHASGEEETAEWVIAAYEKPQETGSALTYARRYTASCVLGIATEDDDDGQAAQQGEPQRATGNGNARPAPAKAAQAPASKPAAIASAGEPGWTVDEFADSYIQSFDNLDDGEGIKALWSAATTDKAWADSSPTHRAGIREAMNAAAIRLAGTPERLDAVWEGITSKQFNYLDETAQGRLTALKDRRMQTLEGKVTLIPGEAA